MQQKERIDRISNILDKATDIALLLEKSRSMAFDVNNFLTPGGNEPDALFAAYRNEYRVKSDIELDYLAKAEEELESLLRCVESFCDAMQKEAQE